MAKSSRLGAKGSFVIRERKVKSFIASVRRHSACSITTQVVLYCTVLKYDTVQYICGSTTEPERFGKVRPLGSKGRTPYKVMQGSVCILAFFHVLRALATTEKTLRHAAGAQARAYLHEEACTVARHPHPS